MIKLINPIRRSKHIVIKSDAHPSLKSLSQLFKDNLNDSGINLVLGNVHNKNSNCHVDKIIQELEYEIRKSHNSNASLTNFDLANATFALNSKLRRHDLSSSEILFKRNQNSDTSIEFNDESLQKAIRESQTKQQAKSSRPVTVSNVPSPGTMVMLKQNPNKHSRRLPFLVTEQVQGHIKITKILNIDSDRNMKLSTVSHTVHPEEIYTVTSVSPGLYPHNLKDDTNVQEANPWLPISQWNDSDSDSEIDDNDNYSISENLTNLPLSEQFVEPSEHLNQSKSISSDPSLSPEILHLNTGARPKLKEKWITKKMAQRNEKINKLKETIAAVKIQTWYKKHIVRKRVHRHCMKLRDRTNHKSPEILRSKSLNNLSDISWSNDEDMRRIESDSKDTLDWDSTPECLELDENKSHIQNASKTLKLQFGRDSTDFNKVYTFDNALPLTKKVYDFSQILPISPMKTKKKSKFKYIKKLLSNKKSK